MKTLELNNKTVKELKAIAKDNNIQVSRKATKDEVIELLADLVVDTTDENTFNWDEVKTINARTLRGVERTDLESYPGFSSDADFEKISDSDLRTLVIAHAKNEKAENDEVVIAKRENEESIIALIEEKTTGFTDKLKKEQIASIRSRMQGKSFTKEGRTKISSLLAEHKLSRGSLIEINEWYDFPNAKISRNKVTFDGGECSLLEYSVKSYIRDFGPTYAENILALDKGEEVDMRAENYDKYTTYTFEMLQELKNPKTVIERIQNAFNLSEYPMDHQAYFDLDLEIGSEITLKNSLNAKFKARVTNLNPLYLQSKGTYFTQDQFIAHREMDEFVEVVRTKEELDATKPENYDITKDIAENEEEQDRFKG